LHIYLKIFLVDPDGVGFLTFLVFFGTALNGFKLAGSLLFMLIRAVRKCSKRLAPELMEAVHQDSTGARVHQSRGGRKGGSGEEEGDIAHRLHYARQQLLKELMRLGYELKEGRITRDECVAQKRLLLEEVGVLAGAAQMSAANPLWEATENHAPPSKEGIVFASVGASDSILAGQKKPGRSAQHLSSRKSKQSLETIVRECPQVQYWYITSVVLAAVH
jgi:hypothetical protein